MPGLPVALRAYFSAASIASAPELQKKACAPPKRVGQPLGELLHRLGPVEVRDVPEPVELRVRGGERRGMAVAEADDGDPREEVEVARARPRRRPTRPRRATSVTSWRA